MNPTVEIDTSAAYKPLTPTGTKNPPLVAQVVYQNTTVNVMRQEDDSANKVMIYAVIGSIIGVLVIGSIAAFILYKRYQFKMDHRAKPVDQSSKGDITAQAPGCAVEEQFEDQYHPKATDFVDIFGRGDVVKKMNAADNINVEDEDEDEVSSGAAGGILDSAQRGSNADYTTRNLVTNVRESNIKEDVPLHSLSPVGGKELVINNSRREYNTQSPNDEEVGVPSKARGAPKSGRQMTFQTGENV